MCPHTLVRVSLVSFKISVHLLRIFFIFPTVIFSLFAIPVTFYSLHEPFKDILAGSQPGNRGRKRGWILYWPGVILNEQGHEIESEAVLYKMAVHPLLSWVTRLKRSWTMYNRVTPRVFTSGFQARSKDQEILEEGGGAGPSLLPRRDHE